MDRAAASLSQANGVIAAHAFGSVPEGRAHRESDVDLAVLLDWEQYPSRAALAATQVELLGELLCALGTNR